MTLRTRNAAITMHRHGLSLLELLLAMTITVMVAAAITAMLGAVTSGVGARRDSRAIMVLAHAAQSRLSAYIAPSRCLLQHDGANLVIWLNDNRAGDTVHATEVRWLLFDPSTGVIKVHYVSFPPSWSQSACDLEDHVFSADSNWLAVLAEYRSKGWTASLPLVDTLETAAVTIDQPTVIESRHVLHQLTFRTEGASGPITAASTIRQQLVPSS